MNTIERIEARDKAEHIGGPWMHMTRMEWTTIKAIVEAARRMLWHLPNTETCCGFPVGGYMDNNYCEPPSCCGNPLIPQQEMREALSKLEGE